MKRYILFFGAIYYPFGGSEDIVSTFDTMAEAMEAAFDQIKEKASQSIYGDSSEEDIEEELSYIRGNSWFEVYDLKQMKPVYREEGGVQEKIN